MSLEQCGGGGSERQRRFGCRVTSFGMRGRRRDAGFTARAPAPEPAGRCRRWSTPDIACCGTPRARGRSAHPTAPAAHTCAGPRPPRPAPPRVMIIGGATVAAPGARRSQPARVRSRTKSRSNWANALNMWKIHRRPGRGVDVLGQRSEHDVARGKIGGDVDQVPRRAAQPVQPPHPQGVARAQRLQDPVQLRALLPDPADVIGEHPPTAGRAQRVALQVRVLLQRGDPGVAQQRSHARQRSDTRVRRSARHAETDTGLRYAPTCGEPFKITRGRLCQIRVRNGSALACPAPRRALKGGVRSCRGASRGRRGSGRVRTRTRCRNRSRAPGRARRRSRAGAGTDRRRTAR